MNDRPCEECVYHTEMGCSKWECEPLTRAELTKMLKSGYVVIDGDKLEVDDG